MTKVLISDRTHPVLEERLRQAGFQISVEPDHDYNSLLCAVQGYDALVVRSKVNIDRNFIDSLTPLPLSLGRGEWNAETNYSPLRSERGKGVRLPGVRLRCIGRVGAGMETIDVNYAESHGIRCLNSPEGNRDAVGEHTVGLLLALLNNIARADAQVRQGLWLREANRGWELGNLTVGIIGFGNMGQSFARRLTGFGCKIIYYDKANIPLPSPQGEGLEVRPVSLAELQQRADVVSFHVPLTEETRHYLNDEFIARMAKSFFLLNTSRGAVVDTEALVRGLQSGKVRGAGLDVLENENMQSDSLSTLNSPLSTLNCVFTPHVAGWTVESKYKLAAVLADKIIKTLKSSLTPNPSPSGEGSRMTGSLQLSTPLSPGRGVGGEANHP